MAQILFAQQSDFFAGSFGRRLQLGANSATAESTGLHADPKLQKMALRGILSSKSESNLRQLPCLSPVDDDATSSGYPRRPSLSARSRTNSGRLISPPQEIDHPWETCPFRTLFVVVQDMLVLKYGLELDELDFINKAKARCGPELQPRKLVHALNAEPALKVKDANNERLLQLRLQTTTMSSFAELQNCIRRWPGTACAVAAVGLAGVGRNVQLVAPYREAYGTKDALVARTRPKSNGGVGPLHTFKVETFTTAVVIEPVIERLLKYQPESSVMLELQTPAECPEFAKSAVAFDTEVGLAERFCGALAALAPATADCGATASCLLAKELMSRHPKAADMQVAGCKVLSNWLSHCQQRLSTQQCCAAMEAITAAMRRHNSNAAVQEAGAAAMSGTAGWAELQAAAATNGAVEEVVGAMRRFEGDSELLASGCSALAGLAANHPLNQSSIMACRSIEVIVDAMTRFSKHARLQTMAFGALGNLAANNPNNQAAIVQADGLQRVKVALQQHQTRPVVLTAALAALWCLLKRHSGNTDLAGQLGLAELAMLALRRHPDDRGLKSMASGALKCLVPGLAEALACQASSTPSSVRQDTGLPMSASGSKPMSEDTF